MVEAAPAVDEGADAQLTFPGFEGRPVKGVSVILNGSVRVDDAVSIVGNDDEVRVVLTGKVAGVNHKRVPKTGIVRIQSIEVTAVEQVTVTKRGDGVREIADLRHRQDAETDDPQA